MKKKIVGIITVVCVIAVAVFLLTGKKEKEVVVETPVEETVEEVTEETTNEDGVETDEEVATGGTQESESIVESETTEEADEEETKEETSIVESDKPVESTEVQEVYSADTNDKTPEEIDKEIEEMEKALEEAGLIPEGYEESSSGTRVRYGLFELPPEESGSVGIHF